MESPSSFRSFHTHNSIRFYSSNKKETDEDYRLASNHLTAEIFAQAFMVLAPMNHFKYIQSMTGGDKCSSREICLICGTEVSNLSVGLAHLGLSY